MCMGHCIARDMHLYIIFCGNDCAMCDMHDYVHGCTLAQSYLLGEFAHPIYILGDPGRPGNDHLELS